MLLRIYFLFRNLFFLDFLTLRVASKFNPFILCYHQINKDRVDAQLKWLNKHFDVCSMNKFNQKTRGRCYLTMDDCIHEDFIAFVQLIEKNHLEATFFIPVKYMQRNKAMWYSKVQFIAESAKQIYFNSKGYDLTNPKMKRPFIKDVEAWIYSLKVQTEKAEELIDRIAKENGLEIGKIPDGKKVISERTVIKYLNSKQVDFSSHTMTHPFLFLCDENELIYEVVESGKLITSITEKKSSTFCYPYGSISIIGNLAPLVVEKNYDFAVTLEGGVITESDSPFLLKRIGIYPGDSSRSMVSKICHYQNISWFKKIFNAF